MNISVNEISNVFNKIGKQWLLITASNKSGKVNTMTASWGGLGYIWNKNVAYIFIRPQRYTKEFVDESDCLSISFFDEKFRSMLAYMGKYSGRDVDKIKEQNLHVFYNDNVPCFEEAELTLVCKKLYRQSFKEECFIEKDLIEKYYPTKDYHDVYVVEIIRAIKKDI